MTTLGMILTIVIKLSLEAEPRIRYSLILYFVSLSFSILHIVVLLLSRLCLLWDSRI